MFAFLEYTFGPYGVILGLGLTFGLLFSTHNRSKQIHRDLQLIKRKLGIVKDEKLEEIEYATDEEIEKELEEYRKDKE